MSEFDISVGQNEFLRCQKMARLPLQPRWLDRTMRVAAQTRSRRRAMEEEEETCTALQDLLRTRKREDFMTAIHEQLQINRRLKLQVDELRKELAERDEKLQEANKVIASLSAEVLSLQNQTRQEERIYEDARERKSPQVRMSYENTESQTQAPVDQQPLLVLNGATTSSIDRPFRADNIATSPETLGTEDLQGNEMDDGDDAEYSPTEKDVQSMADEDFPSPSRTRRKKKAITTRKKNGPQRSQKAIRGTQRQRNHKTPLKKPFQSPPCQQKEKKDDNSSDRPFGCKACGKCFSTKSHLTSHLLVHSAEKPFTCNICEKAFKQKSILNTHQATHASKETPLPCPRCQATFTSSTQYRQHIDMHRKQNKLACPRCGKCFSTVTQLKEHKETHAAERPVKCSFCEKTFRNRSGLKEHERTHTGEKPFLCHDCGRSFTCMQHLRTHRRTHTGEKPFVCNECGKGFAQGVTLRKHQLRHTGERPHLCPLCGKAFARPEVLKTHQRVHTGEKPYVCSNCGEAFGYIQSLRSHQMRVHNLKVDVSQLGDATGLPIGQKGFSDK